MKIKYNISEIIIYDNKPIIIGYLRDNNYDNINLETLKNKILKINEKYEKEYLKNREENIIDSSSSCSGGSFQYIRNDGDVTDDYLKCIIKMTEYTPISGGNMTKLNKIPELFLNKRSLLVLKNNDSKYFLYCYIRKFLNPITKNISRITKKDKELADKIIKETNLTFESISINQMNKIEKN